MTSQTIRVAETNHFVKTTISVPSEVYARATRRAMELGTSRSAFFAGAVEKELDATQISVDVIDRINAVVDAINHDTREFTEAASRRKLSKDDGTRW